MAALEMGLRALVMTWSSLTASLVSLRGFFTESELVASQVTSSGFCSSSGWVDGVGWMTEGKVGAEMVEVAG